MNWAASFLFNPKIGVYYYLVYIRLLLGLNCNLLLLATLLQIIICKKKFEWVKKQQCDVDGGATSVLEKKRQENNISSHKSITASRRRTYNKSQPPLSQRPRLLDILPFESCLYAPFSIRHYYQFFQSVIVNINNLLRGCMEKEGKEKDEYNLQQTSSWTRNQVIMPTK